MGAPFVPGRSVAEAARELIDAAEVLAAQRQYAERTAAALDERWAENRRRLLRDAMGMECEPSQDRIVPEATA